MDKSAIEMLFLVWVLFMSSLVLIDLILIGRDIRILRNLKEDDSEDDYSTID